MKIACSPFASGRLRYVFNKVLGPVDAQRVRLAILPDPDCRMESWWRSRGGVKEFMYGWLGLIYAWAKGDEARPRPVGAAAFQRKSALELARRPHETPAVSLLADHRLSAAS